MKRLGSAAIAILALSCLFAQKTATPRNADSEREARQVIDAFFAAFNKSDSGGVRRTVHFPHIRIASGRVTVIPSAKEWKGDPTPLAAEDWHHSTLDSVQFVHGDAEKVHAAIVFSRYRADGARYATHHSLWIITRQDGRWGVQGRSSFAP